MVLAPGTRFGPYEIAAPLGAGGMGEVYRAHDPRLGREVAIKVLRGDAFTPADRRRLELEARAASRLNHPNILTIHDIGEADGSPFIVSELLEGEALRRLIQPGGMQVRKLLDCAVQIAAGLEAAHAHSLVHRDLKPENVMVLRDGRLKILDFGLAKVGYCSPGEDLETRTAIRVRGNGGESLSTDPDLLVGTLAYMSPEQIQGAPLDFRSDQFSFGSVLYEMATGSRPFQRLDCASVMSAIVHDDPVPVAQLNPRVPAPLRWVIERCLAKELSQRFASTADLHQQLRDIRDHLSEITRSDASVRRPSRRLPVKAAALSLAALLCLSAGFLLAWLAHRHDRGISSYKFTPFATEASDEMQPAWSPNGKAIAYAGTHEGVSQIFVRALDSPVPAQITKSATACFQPFWSPDSTHLYFWSENSIWSVGAAGGTPWLVVRDAIFPAASISPDGKTLAFFRFEGGMRRLLLLDTPSGTVTPYRKAPFPEAFRLNGGVAFSRSGRQLLVSILPAIEVERAAEVWVLPMPDGVPRRVPQVVPFDFRGILASWLPDDRRVAFSAELVPGDGIHLYLLDTLRGRIETLTVSAMQEREPSVSPDGQRLAFASGSSNSDLVEVSADGRSVAPLLATARNENSGQWSPLGDQFAYISDANGLPEVWIRNPAQGWARPVVRGSEGGYLEHATPSFAPDGQRLAYVRVGERHAIWISHLSGGQAVQLETESSDQHAPAWSPDGNWIAYARFHNRRWEIAKAPAAGGAKPVSLQAGATAGSTLAWSPSGTWIAYSDQDGLHVLPAEGGPARRLLPAVASFYFERDHDTVTVLRRTPERRWELAQVQVTDGRILQRAPVPALRPDATVWRISRHPTGSRLIASLTNYSRDIWLLDGWNRSGWSEFFAPKGRNSR